MLHCTSLCFTTLNLIMSCYFMLPVSQASPVQAVVGSDANFNIQLNDYDATQVSIKHTTGFDLMTAYGNVATIDNPMYRDRLNFTGNTFVSVVSFILRNVTLADAGIYKAVCCGGFRIYAKTIGSQMLIVKDSPSKPQIIELNNQAVNGSDYHLNCSAQSNSEPPNHNLTMLSEWRKDNLPVTSTGRYIVNETELTIIGLDYIQDSMARLTCVAFEDQLAKSVNSDEIVIDVKYGPVNIHVNPSNGDITERENRQIIVNCTADCNPPCSFQWRKELVPTPLANSQTLILNTVSKNDTGRYLCSISNNITGISQTAQITIMIIYGPSSAQTVLSPSEFHITAEENSLVNINCSADCCPDCNFIWSGPRGFFQMSALLSRIVDRNKDGNYTCIATNQLNLGKTATTSATVIVLYGPGNSINLGSIPQILHVDLYKIAPDITCSATCNPPCDYRWYQNGTFYRHGATLSLGVVEKTTRGNYRCEAYNSVLGVNRTSSISVNINVYYPPDVLVDYSGSGLTNSTVVLTCIASGQPSQYTFHEWIHKVGETEIRKLTGQNTANTSILTLPYISIEDMGTYVCTVDNSITGQNGQIKQTGHSDIFVRGTPFIENKNITFIGMINKSARIEIPFYCNPSSTTVKFYRCANTVEVTNTSDTLIFLSSFLNTFTFYGKEILLNGQIAILYFRTVRTTDYGEYTAVLFNDIGSTSRRIVFSSGEPETPMNFHVTDVQEKQVTLQWLSGNHRGFDQTFVVQISMDNITWNNASLINAGKKEGWFSTTITGLKSNTAYYFRLYSFNVYGGGDCADISFVTRTLKESVSSLDIGAFLGIGFGGIFLGVVGTISVIIIIRKRITATPNYSSTSETDMDTDMQTYDNATVSSSPAPSPYEELEQVSMEKPMYDRT